MNIKISILKHGWEFFGEGLLSVSLGPLPMFLDTPRCFIDVLTNRIVLAEHEAFYPSVLTNLGV